MKFTFKSALPKVKSGKNDWPESWLEYGAPSDYWLVYK